MKDYTIVPVVVKAVSSTFNILSVDGTIVYTAERETHGRMGLTAKVQDLNGNVILQFPFDFKAQYTDKNGDIVYYFKIPVLNISGNKREIYDKNKKLICIMNGPSIQDPSGNEIGKVQMEGSNSLFSALAAGFTGKSKISVSFDEKKLPTELVLLLGLLTA